jgi:hypothetical protein
VQELPPTVGFYGPVLPDVRNTCGLDSRFLAVPVPNPITRSGGELLAFLLSPLLYDGVHFFWRLLCCLTDPGRDLVLYVSPVEETEVKPNRFFMTGPTLAPVYPAFAEAASRRQAKRHFGVQTRTMKIGYHSIHLRYALCPVLHTIF